MCGGLERALARIGNWGGAQNPHLPAAAPAGLLSHVTGEAAGSMCLPRMFGGAIISALAAPSFQGVAIGFDA